MNFTYNGPFAIALLMLAKLGIAEPHSEFEGVVDRVLDGDTVDVVPCTDAERVRIRLSGIDAPERSQVGAAQSTNALSRLVHGRKVTVRVIDIDTYGRTVGRIYVDDLDVSLSLVRAGHAWAYRAYTSDAALLSAETVARQRRLGIWASAEPIPPWAWRARERSARAGAGAPRTDRTPAVCGMKRTCSEMTSCEEAAFYLEKCGLLRLDGDRDGVPCESLCRE